MITFEVKDMTCGHCVGAVTRAVNELDPQARLSIDLPTHTVQVEPASANAASLADAIRDAGYTPVPVVSEAAQPAAAPAAGKGCCCRS